MCKNDHLSPKFAMGPLDESTALTLMPTANDSLLLLWCPVGQSFTDSDGYFWSRVQDVP